MRNIVLGLGISIDGYIARPNGSVDFLFMPPDYSMAPFFQTVDTAIMGRKTYDISLSMGDFGSAAMDSYVFSRTLPPGKRNGVTFLNSSPEAFVTDLRSRPGKDIWFMGGGELGHAFLQADLIDELYLGIVPTLIGEGLPLFPPGFPQRNFELTECKSFSQGLVTLRYKRAR